MPSPIAVFGRVRTIRTTQNLRNKKKTNRKKKKKSPPILFTNTNRRTSHIKTRQKFC